MEEAAINVMKDTAGTAEVSFNLKNMISLKKKKQISRQFC
jgi:hypothetical protein